MRAWSRFVRWLRRQRLAMFCGHASPEHGYIACHACHVLCCPRCLAQHITEHYPLAPCFDDTTAAKELQN